jgi:putative transposase
MIYHALNRGNRGEAVFQKPADYDDFVETMAQACQRVPVGIFGYCLMPNHFHLVLRPKGDGDLGQWMQWVLTTHVRRFNRDYHMSGHVWQGRFKAFPIQNDDHVETVLRYVERNPVRAKLVGRAEQWKWSSLPGWLSGDPVLLRAQPRPRGRDWLKRLSAPLPAGELERLRVCVARGTPFGTDLWTARTVKRLGLESTIRPRGRPKKT